MAVCSIFHAARARSGTERRQGDAANPVGATEYYPRRCGGGDFCGGLAQSLPRVRSAALPWRREKWTCCHCRRCRLMRWRTREEEGKPETLPTVPGCPVVSLTAERAPSRPGGMAVRVPRRANCINIYFSIAASPSKCIKTAYRLHKYGIVRHKSKDCNTLPPVVGASSAPLG